MFPLPGLSSIIVVPKTRCFREGEALRYLRKARRRAAIVEEGHGIGLRKRHVIGDRTGQFGNLGKHHLRDEGKIQCPRLCQRNPVEMRKLIACTAKIIGIASDSIRIDNKEPRIEAPGASGRRDGAENVVQLRGIGASVPTRR